MKAGLLLIGIASLLKLGVAISKRVDRYQEVSSALEVQLVKLSKIQSRFDRFFTIGGDKRLMNEHEEWIAPNRIRVVWR